GISRYPTTRGEASLRQAASRWLERRFDLIPGSVNPETQLLPVNGTREALYSIVHAITGPQDKGAVILMPNPFYQIYEGASIMAGATPIHVPATEANHFLPDYSALPPDILARTKLLFYCSPANPTGAITPEAELKKLLQLAETYDFVLAADECYSEIWYQQQPPGLLKVAQDLGRTGFERCLVFHSLSKRSNMPGARSGFVAGDAKILKPYFQLRTYTGCATPPFIQQAATAAWNDEAHVEENRIQYRQKLADALEILQPILPVQPPQAGFYLWLRVPRGGETFTRHLFHRYHVTVLPGAYLGRGEGVNNPGDPYIRIAMVQPRAENREGIRRIAAAVHDLG
ncbi:MAG TPA: aminotransferase class I/II-fold pyridoxal phosphate-dependent enzyme, partial [Magnetococcales bacterium]|nr:aminotransferase class I/II-fold pyridoxal phosphate-dependent enzyme [Magnetococcales bacterium]